MVHEVETALGKIRQNLNEQNSDIQLLSATDLGVVRVSLSGECCVGRLSRLLTILDIEKAVKDEVPAVKIVIEG